jgi:hypothetical protein
MGYYTYIDFGTWTNAQLVTIGGCYLAIVGLIFIYFLIEDDRETEK